jgi:hypothetical protein
VIEKATSRLLLQGLVLVKANLSKPPKNGEKEIRSNKSPIDHSKSSSNNNNNNIEKQLRRQHLTEHPALPSRSRSLPVKILELLPVAVLRNSNNDHQRNRNRALVIHPPRSSTFSTSDTAAAITS